MRVLYCFYGIASMPMGVSLDFSLFFSFSYLFILALVYMEFGSGIWGGVEAGAGGLGGWKMECCFSLFSKDFFFFFFKAFSGLFFFLVI